MTATEPSNRADHKNSVSKTREEGVCPICSQGFEGTYTEMSTDGVSGAFYVHEGEDDDAFVELCVDHPDGSTTERQQGYVPELSEVRH